MSLGCTSESLKRIETKIA